MYGVWFWWGDKEGREVFQSLWRMLYERFVSHHGLDNLLWAWSANAPRDIPKDEAFGYRHYYPGRDYVDMLATDVYHFTDNTPERVKEIYAHPRTLPHDEASRQS